MADMAGNRVDDQAFEDEVRRIAALLYPDPQGGASIEQGRERDGVYVTEDTVALVEATRSTGLEKAQKDGAKLKSLANEMARKYPYHAVKAFFITEKDPTAHQLDAIRKLGAPLAASSFHSFRNRLINVSDYLSVRNDYAFGSARDPETNDYKVKDPYIPLDFMDLDDPARRCTTDELVARVASGQRVVLLGEFGAGKSMTLREVYFRFRAEHFTKRSDHFCIHLNVNDHQGQSDPVEALERHARRIGYYSPAQLVRAWRSGYAHLILDGFDEVFVPGWASGARPLREIRRKSVELVRRFMSESPATCGVLVAGRRHFFDDQSEMRGALGLLPNSLVLSATDFTEAQVQAYLSNRNWSTALPAWLPRRPLLIGYLAGRKLLGEAATLVTEPGAGWTALLDAICEREARTDVGIDAGSIRSILERLATRARKTSSGRGPLNFEDMASVFVELQGYQPDQGALLILQRLPGLQVDDIQHNTRSFIDDDLVDAARSGDVLAWLANPSPHSTKLFKHWTTSMGDVGLQTLRARCEAWGITNSAVRAATIQLSRVDEVDYALADVVRLMFSLGAGPSAEVTIDNVVLPSVECPESTDCSLVTFTNCLIEFVDINGCEAKELPTFYSCSIDKVDGANSFDGLGKFINTEAREFLDSSSTLAAIRGLDLPHEAQIALSILKKVYAQAGSARKEGALFRGLPVHLRGDVGPVLAALMSLGVIVRDRRGNQTLYSGVRAQASRVSQVLDAPALHRSDELLHPLSH